MLKVSIIVPIFNSEKYLNKCIDSIINQSLKEIEIILINDGSKDNSELICNNYAKKDNRIRVISKKNEGVSSARNCGLKMAKGEYVLFVDSDDWLELNMCEVLYKEASLGDYDVVMCGFKEFNDYKKSYKDFIINNVSDDKILDIILSNSYPIKGFLFNKLLKREKITKEFNDKIFIKEDLMFLLENVGNITKYKIIKDELYNYRITESSLSHSKKVNINRISSLYVDKYIVEKFNTRYIDFYKFLFVHEYCFYFFNMSLDQKSILKEKYETNFKKYYKEVLKSNNISYKEKIKLFIKEKIMYIYFRNR